jgi:CRP-like cAMP-binding protein
MEELIAYILKFGDLSQDEVKLITSKFHQIKLNRQAYFSEVGKIPRQVGFILNGVIRVFYYNDKGEEITRFFIMENNFVVDLKNFSSSLRATAYVQAITDCDLIVISQIDWNKFSTTITGWDQIVNKLVSASLLQKIERITPLITEDATTRYLAFLERYPQLTNRVPLAYVASYLGITQSSLSRIRKKIR